MDYEVNWEGERLTTGYSTNPRQVNIAVVMNPLQVNDVVGLEIAVTNIVDVLKPIANKIFIITGGYPQPDDEKVRIIPVKPKIITGERDKLTISRVLEHSIASLRLCFHLLKLRRHIDIVMYHFGGKTYPLSMMIARLLRKKVILFSFNTSQVGLSLRKRGLITQPSIIYMQALNLLEKICFAVADRIWVESASIISFSKLDKYKRKISICGTPYVDTTRFKKKLEDRKKIVGFIGRLEERKGIMDFIAAIPLILAQRQDIEFRIVGTGSLLGKIEGKLRNSPYHDQVKLLGWIERGQVNQLLNELKLFVLPSYSEGLPAVVKEAMACGTPMLATPVGGIPDLIKDSETGFIMQDNSPECIAKGIIRALEHPGLNEIAQNARELIEKEYSYQVMVEKYRCAINEVMALK